MGMINLKEIKLRVFTKVKLKKMMIFIKDINLINFN